MNMQTSIAIIDRSGPTLSVHQLLVVALALVDELGLPGRIGADIDLAINAVLDLLVGSETALLN